MNLPDARLYVNIFHFGRILVKISALYNIRRMHTICLRPKAKVCLFCLSNQMHYSINDVMMYILFSVGSRRASWFKASWSKFLSAKLLVSAVRQTVLPRHTKWTECVFVVSIPAKPQWVYTDLVRTFRFIPFELQFAIIHSPAIFAIHAKMYSTGYTQKVEARGALLFSTVSVWDIWQHANMIGVLMSKAYWVIRFPNNCVRCNWRPVHYICIYF